MNAWVIPAAAVKFVATINFAARILLFATLAGFASVHAFPQAKSAQATNEASVEGIVRDASGKPVAGASVLLVKRGDATSNSLETKTAVDGTFSFSAQRAGAFAVSVEKTGMCASAARSVDLSAGEKKHVEIVLDAQAPAADTTGATNVTNASGHAASNGCSPNSMEFSDQPNFVIAGITDWSNLGLHGSDATTRTSEALAKETLALKSGDARESAANGGAEAAATHRLSGDRAEHSNDPVTAVREYEQAARLDPSEENYFAWGSELLLHHATQPAAEVFTKGSALHPKSVRMLVGLGAAMYANGLRDEAAQRVCEASDLRPADSAPYLFLGKMEETAVEPVPCGEEKLARFAREQPGNALANYFYALSIWKRKRQSDDPAEFRQTEALLEKAVAIDPALGEAYLQLGIVYAAQDDFARAAQVLRKAVAANPQLGEAHRRLGQAYQRLGETAKAEQEFALFKLCQKNETDTLERQRRELRQFLVILQDQPATTTPH